MGQNVKKVEQALSNFYFGEYLHSPQMENFTRNKILGLLNDSTGFCFYSATFSTMKVLFCWHFYLSFTTSSERVGHKILAKTTAQNYSPVLAAPSGIKNSIKKQKHNLLSVQPEELDTSCGCGCTYLVSREIVSVDFPCALQVFVVIWYIRHTGCIIQV